MVTEDIAMKVVIPPAHRARWFRVPFSSLTHDPLPGMDVSIPPTPLPGTLPPGAARCYKPIFGPKWLPKPFCYLVLHYDPHFQAFHATSGPIFQDFRPFSATKTTHFARQGRRFRDFHNFEHLLSTSMKSRENQRIKK